MLSFFGLAPGGLCTSAETQDNLVLELLRNSLCVDLIQRLRRGRWWGFLKVPALGGRLGACPGGRVASCSALRGRSHRHHMTSAVAAGVWFHRHNVSAFSEELSHPLPHVVQAADTAWSGLGICRRVSVFPCPHHSKQTGDVKTQCPEKCVKKGTKR